jgi:hypothetical protein
VWGVIMRGDAHSIGGGRSAWKFCSKVSSGADPNTGQNMDGDL